MIDADRSGTYVSGPDAGTPSAKTKDDYCDYIADMLLEMQRMATKSGRRGLADVLGAAYIKAREEAGGR